MRDIIDRQTFVFSCGPLNTDPSQFQTPMNLRFAADAMVLKSISYADTSGIDVADVVQIWCNITNDNLIGAFPNSGGQHTPIFLQCDQYFILSNTFQTGNLMFQFQQTQSGAARPFLYNPQPLISDQIGGSNTNGVVVLTIEFLKHSK